MSFKATNMLPRQGVEEAANAAIFLRDLCIARSNQFATDTNADVVLATLQDLRRRRDQLLLIKDIPGIGEYAKAQYNDSNYDIGLEFTALISVVDDVLVNIVSTFPTDSDSYLLEKKFNPDGTYAFRTMTSAQLTTLRSLLNAVVNSVV